MSRRGRGHDRTGRSKKSPPFLMVPHRLLDHPAYRALDSFSQQALTYMARHYKGPRGFRVMASVRWISDGTGQSKNRAEKSLSELQRGGFIVPLETGHMGAEGRGAGTIWRVTFLAAEGVGATNDHEQIWDARNLESRPSGRDKGCPSGRDKGGARLRPALSLRKGQGSAKKPAEPCPSGRDDSKESTT